MSCGLRVGKSGGTLESVFLELIDESERSWANNEQKG